jgi:class 3 adenylate cyclase
VLHEIVAAEAGAVVKTIGDAVMATFPTPDRALAAALRMREEMGRLNDERKREGSAAQDRHSRRPVSCRDAQRPAGLFRTDGQHRARVQGLCTSREILATQPVVGYPESSKLLAGSGLAPVARPPSPLRGVAEPVAVYAIP